MIKSIHLSLATLSCVGSLGQQSQQRYQDFPDPSHIFQLTQQNPKLYPLSFPRGTCSENLSREASRWHLKQMPEPLRLVTLVTWKGQRFIPGDQAPITQPPYGGNSFWPLVSVTHSFGHYPKFMTISELSSFFTTTDTYNNCITADTALLHLLIFYYLFIHLVTRPGDT